MSRGCSCQRKVFATESQANDAIDRMRKWAQREGIDRELPKRAYPCPSGKGWHMTSQDGDTEGRDHKKRLAHDRRRRDRR